MPTNLNSFVVPCKYVRFHAKSWFQAKTFNGSKSEVRHLPSRKAWLEGLLHTLFSVGTKPSYHLFQVEHMPSCRYKKLGRLGLVIYRPEVRVNIDTIFLYSTLRSLYILARFAHSSPSLLSCLFPWVLSYNIIHFLLDIGDILAKTYKSLVCLRSSKISASNSSHNDIVTILGFCQSTHHK